MKALSLSILFLFMSICLSSASIFAENPSLKITEMTVTTKIFRGNPVDSVKSLSSSSLKGLYCFTRIQSSAEVDTSVRHIWYHKGAMVGEQILPVRGEQWRTYSKKIIEKGLRGPWKVEAVDGEGNLLKSVEFMMN